MQAESLHNIPQMVVNSVILKWIGDDKDKYIIACYDLALTDLKDKDRPYWIRKYFHVESKF